MSMKNRNINNSNFSLWDNKYFKVAKTRAGSKVISDISLII